jgi:predicted small lipoprotein YifL
MKLRLRNLRVALPCLALPALLAGCGQKGDLYLPAQEQEAVITVPTDASGAPQSGDEDESQVNGPATPNTQGAGTDGR